ncbi:hypothetical protein HY251_16645 [bacterium]|nr:hypothetical protein [bacterium]
MPSYMFLFRAPKTALTMARSPESARESGERWHSWGEALRESGHLTDGGQLQPGGQCVRGAEKKITEGAFGDDHQVGGYFLVKAASLAEATELAKGCPVLPNGGTVEVRPLVSFD